ncbi:MAG TPA: DMT family transporter [Acidobacteriota bacterium]|nr:DMT family transporter [Acidobacteriota bacterium]
MNDSRQPSRLRIAVVLSFGLLAISSGSVLVRFSQEAPTLTIAFYRLALAALFLSPFYWADRRRQGEAQRDSPGLVVAAGLALALHFAFWFASLRYTSVAVSVLLVYTAPIPVAVISYFWFGERLTRWGVAGFLVTFSGSALLVYNDLEVEGGGLGALLSVVGGAAFAVYLVLGRRLRQGRTLLQYVVPTYAAAALFLGAAVVLSGLPLTGFESSTYASMVLLAVFPQCLGHTSYNWSLRFLSATLVSLLVLAEPVVASALAYWLLGEPVTGLIWLGGVLVGSGIWMVATRGTRLETAQGAYVETL